ncbi:MAG TPA: phospholipase D-like domain-containing protein [Labilithrix sp.]|nr:phospholipase D-like domain-containing protein [Labilithrix sp.]
MDRILTGKTTWRRHEQADAALLIDVQDYYRAFYQAVSRAKRSVLILGWQFDSDVQLLRGDDLPPGADPKACELLPLLDRLCRERPELEVKMLAWDHSLFFALEREVLQKVVFDMATVDRFTFKTDGTVPWGGSHHQKVAVIDGQIAFMGSADLCQDRWDTSAHVGRDPLRVSRRDEAYKPYHEVQAVFTGAPVRSLLELFGDRWAHATGQPIDLDAVTVPAPPGEDLLEALPVTLRMPRSCVAFARTVPQGPGRAHVHEIRDLHVRAIHSARRLIYIETQYLTSGCVRDALVARLSSEEKPKLDVVLVLPHKPEKFKEEYTLAEPQAAVIDALVEAARAGGHALGIYNVAAPDDAGDGAAFVYIHSKLMIVDDRFLTVGSANLANRSMTVDSEINAVWVAPPGDHVLHAAIRRVRTRLLLEHLGEAADVRVVVRPQGLVARLDRVIEEGRGRLRHHDLVHEVPNALSKAVQELACEVVDPQDGAEPLPPPSSIRQVRA